MKKLLILSLALLCTAVLLQATELRTGALLGGLMAEVSSTPDNDSNNIYHFATGVYLDYRFGGGEEYGWGLQTQLLYTNRGCKIPSQDGSANERYDLSYLQLPIIARIEFRIGNIIPYVGGGLYGGYNLAAKHKVSDSKSDLEDVEPFEVGVIAGNGISWGRYSIEMRYEQGLNPFYDRNGLEMTNIAYTVLLGYSF